MTVPQLLRFIWKALGAGAFCGRRVVEVRSFSWLKAPGRPHRHVSVGARSVRVTLVGEASSSSRSFFFFSSSRKVCGAVDSWRGSAEESIAWRGGES